MAGRRMPIQSRRVAIRYERRVRAFHGTSASRRRALAGRGPLAQAQLHRHRAHPARAAARGEGDRRPRARIARDHDRRGARAGRPHRRRGRRRIARPLPFTPRAKKTLERSLREALSLGHRYIGTEHILLGLVSVEEGVAVRVFEALDAGVEPEDVRAQVLQLVGGGRRGSGRPGCPAGGSGAPALARDREGARPRAGRGTRPEARCDTSRAHPARAAGRARPRCPRARLPRDLRRERPRGVERAASRPRERRRPSRYRSRRGPSGRSTSRGARRGRSSRTPCGPSTSCSGSYGSRPAPRRSSGCAASSSTCSPRPTSSDYRVTVAHSIREISL